MIHNHYVAHTIAVLITFAELNDGINVMKVTIESGFLVKLFSSVCKVIKFVNLIVDIMEWFINAQNIPEHLHYAIFIQNQIFLFYHIATVYTFSSEFL